MSKTKRENQEELCPMSQNCRDYRVAYNYPCENGAHGKCVIYDSHRIFIEGESNMEVKH
jgi:hypothetical protein|tara:strand:- start:134 stop:310 length:177 start_codon:yes stop_codon:yes gene_type:complete